MPGDGQISVPPGFRFHPTDEELLYYYLRKKVSYEAIDLDVIREVDLNKLEPWDLKEKCRIGSGPQNEWYFFSHKDKKYPTGTRTNRATTAGFWKATGRDKAIHLSNSSKRIGMRKTLVFYTGRAPHGQKTDWIMHEYRLDENDDSQVQEDGWVVCRVFKKKSHSTCFQPDLETADKDEHFVEHRKIASAGSVPLPMLERKQNVQMQYRESNFNFDGSNSLHLPQLLSPDHEFALNPSYLSPISFFNTMEIECSHNLLRLTTPSSTGTTDCGGGAGGTINMQQHERFIGDWSFLDKLLANSNCNHNQLEHQDKFHTPSLALDVAGPSTQRFPFQYHGSETDVLKFSN